MMRMKTKLTGLTSLNGGGGGGGRSTVNGHTVLPKNNTVAGVAPSGESGAAPIASEWELRPGGMLVQKRCDSDQNTTPTHLIRVRVKYGSTYHELTINSQASFGELKKKLSGPTGLHHEDQKIFFKNKQRDSKAYLDIAGVKDKSKLVLQEDPISQEKRFLEMRKNANLEKAAKSISQISLQVDKLAAQVQSLESVISKGGKVAEKEVLNLIELLMNELIKLDGIVADGDIKLQRKTQVMRVQKYVETLDVLKIKNTKNSSSPPNGVQTPFSQQQHQQQPQPQTQQKQSQPNGQRGSHPQSKRTLGPSPLKPQSESQFQPHQHHQQQPSSRHQRQPSNSSAVTTQWEIFDSMPPLISVSSSPPRAAPALVSHASSPMGNGVNHYQQNQQHHHHPKFTWESFE